jgi:hypothetical protein
MKRLLLFIVVSIVLFTLVMLGFNKFASTYNKVIVEKRQIIEQRVQTLQDSILLTENKFKELKRIKELSFTMPIRPEQVRGEELRAVIEGMTSCEVWLFNKKNEKQALQQQVDELNESLISLL